MLYPPNFSIFLLDKVAAYVISAYWHHIVFFDERENFLYTFSCFEAEGDSKTFNKFFFST